VRIGKRGEVGALHGKRARKGIFITTSAFSAEAVRYVATIDPKVVLIDGAQLAEIMIEFNVGVSAVAKKEVVGLTILGVRERLLQSLRQA